MDYAAAFETRRGKCFRYVYDRNKQPARCPEPIVTDGWFRDRSGRWWRVDACAEHAGQLGSRR